MRSIKKTTERLMAIDEILDDVEYNLSKACEDVQRQIKDIECDLDFDDFVQMTRSGELRGGPNSFDKLKQALEEVMDNKLHELTEAILLTILALKSFREKTERD